ncbi:site-2 protease family protein [Legionella oakridgensis]|uniref:Zn-dependent protease n=2 Tax=Legionella oakridgensis TaxID=29423 RepID=W0BGB5_9GAMM|nr:site-2 protease family protein [Legionella oakridgensis]AHE67662.1 Zn-dependent protease [Legionella oakridgensis ATCC 33761 = DSM 21215]ETO92890.1 Zn-dependent protease [Legionella oakridgensis RV-2-2007]KTD37003.1 transmembrane protein [Legionella oakridgensis]STY20688.1 transmembrane protein [Legionella longbeachae]
MPTLTLIQKIAVWAIPVLLAITLHEAAHAWVASRFGDTTAKKLGRLSINPLHHIDLVGTILVPLFVGILTKFNFVFGWAKPVPIDWDQLRNPRRDMIFVSLAGPITNLIMAFFWAACFKLAWMLNPQFSLSALFLMLASQAGIIINLILAFFNLLPVPPLDGSRIVACVLSPAQAAVYLRLERFGFLIMLILLITGILGWLLNPLLIWSLYFIKYLFNL